MDSEVLREAAGMRPIPGFERYAACKNGRIYSFSSGQAKPLSEHLSSNGYKQLSLRKPGKSYTKRVHVLVLEAFCGRRPSATHHARHLDGDKHNNKLENLSWGTALENIEDQRRHGTLVCGARAGRSALTERQVQEIRARISKGETCKGLAREYCVSDTAILNIKHGRTWTHLPAPPVTDETHKVIDNG